jgi:Domain of unknown function (DUF1844)
MAGNEEQEGKKEFLPPLEFGSLVLPFFMQALIKLGEVEDPIAKTTSQNLELGKRLVDLLDLLRDRTKGNLEEEEEKFLEACLARLKLAYIERMKVVKT